MSLKEKRIRSINWDEEEKELFRSVLQEFLMTIENKSLDNKANKLKTKAWEKVHEKFNELNGRLRSLSQLKIQWKTMKINARKEVSLFKRATNKRAASQESEDHETALGQESNASMILQDNAADNITQVKNDMEAFTPNNIFMHIKKLKNSSISPSCSAKSNKYIDTMVNYSKSLKDQEHQKRLEILEVELNTQKEKFKSAILEREILELKKAKELMLPTELHLRVSWLRALNKQNSHLPNPAVVSSQHFLNEDMCEMESGLRQARVGAVPSTVQVCMICLDTDSKLFSMDKYNLEKTYENLTGHPLCAIGNLCVECAQRLVNFRKFRDKSLRARNLMLDLVKKHQSVTKQHIKSIDRVKNELESNITKTTLGPDRYNSYGLEHIDEYKESEIDTLVEEDTENITVIKEEIDEAVPMIEVNAEIKLGTENNENDIDDDFVISYDDDISDEGIVRDKKLMNNDLCKVLLRKISSSEVEGIQKQLKQQNAAYERKERFSDEINHI